MNDEFLISASPHIHQKDDIPRIMWTVVCALLPAFGYGVYLFGPRVVVLGLICVIGTLVSEYLVSKIRKIPPTLLDGSAFLTGLLLSMTLPPSFPFTSALIGAIVAIVIGKAVFGGLGCNIFNPALVGRAFLQAAFPVAMTAWTGPFTWHKETMDAVTTATPLALAKFNAVFTSYRELFIGNVGGCLGETSALLLILAGGYLLMRGYIDWRIPSGIILGVVVMGGLFHSLAPQKYPDPIFHILSGGLLLGAFFMATDYVTSPVTPLGSWIFAFSIGIMVVIIRLFSGLPEGVMYSILLLNSFVPLLNRYTRPRAFGSQPAPFLGKWQNRANQEPGK